MDANLRRRPLLFFSLKFLQFVAKRLPQPEPFNPDMQEADKAEARASWERIKLLWRRPVTQTGPISEETRRFFYGVTWGLAGVATLFIIAIVSANRHGTALWIALVCLSAAVPLLVVLGTLLLMQCDPGATRPTTGWVLTTYLLGWLALPILFIGIVAYLWSYNWIAAIVFLIAGMGSRQLFSRYLKSIQATKGALASAGIQSPDARGSSH